MDTEAASSNRIYEDFEPFCKWHSDEGQDTLDIDLEGFKKEQLKVQVNNNKGILAIFGEKPLEASKWSRFRKEVNVPKDTVKDKIQARFSQTNGILSIVMPKKVIQPSTIEPGDKTKGADHATSSGIGSLDDKGSVWGVKISQKRAFKVAVVAAAVVLVVAIGTRIAQLVHGHPSQHLAAPNGHVVYV
ncbi:hypothetical protein L6164_006307 [Bauhinia variegata]|uniref:Uncharacterized protein n=1 Tax=Bauhinia variegata TaxID=167791 RepID=A0ACB9PTF6_BAUVA|nr:hypothetical protein L6164_006307 [Bauhinia variegata]